MTSDIIRLKIGFKQPVTFALRMLSFVEEQKIREKYLALTPDEKAAGKEHEINVQVLADYSEELPHGTFPNKPETANAADKTVYLEDFLAPSLAVRKYFAEKTVAKERIAEYGVRAFLAAHMPEISF